MDLVDSTSILPTVPRVGALFITSKTDDDLNGPWRAKERVGLTTGKKLGTIIAIIVKFTMLEKRLIAHSKPPSGAPHLPPPSLHDSTTAGHLTTVA